MPTLAITKGWADGDILLEADLDAIRNAILTFINTTKLDGDNLQADCITGAFIADDAIDSEHYVDGSIDKIHLSADCVDGTKIADDSINSEHYVDGSIDKIHLSADCVDGTKIGDDSINSEHYVDGSIDAAHIASGQITQVKMGAVGQQVSSSCGSFSTASASLVDVTNLSVTITTTGRPVIVAIISDATGSAAAVGSADTGTVSTNSIIAFYRDAVQIGAYSLNMANETAGTIHIYGMGSPMAIDVVSAGTYTYKLQASAGTGDTAYVSNYKLIAYEL